MNASAANYDYSGGEKIVVIYLKRIVTKIQPLIYDETLDQLFIRSFYPMNDDHFTRIESDFVIVVCEIGHNGH